MPNMPQCISRSTAALWLSCGLLFANIGLAAAAEEDKPVRKPAELSEDSGDLLVSVGFREMFDKRLRERLQNGFATNVVMRIYLYEQHGGKPVIAQGRSIRAVYDLWDERYLLRFEDHRGTSHERFERQSDVIDRLTSLWRFPICKLSELVDGRSYFVAIYAEVNPLDPELLKEVRHWLRKPTRRQRIGSGENFFGSFVSIFLNNRVSRGEKSYRVRTQLFTRQIRP